MWVSLSHSLSVCVSLFPDLLDIQERGRDDFELNAALRKGARLKRRAAAAELADGAAIGLPMPLLPPSPVDAAAAARVPFGHDRIHRFEVIEKSQRAAIASQSIFGQPAAASAPSAAVKRVKLGVAPVLVGTDEKGKLLTSGAAKRPPVPAFAKPGVAKIVPKPKVKPVAAAPPPPPSTAAAPRVVPVPPPA